MHFHSIIFTNILRFIFANISSLNNEYDKLHGDVFLIEQAKIEYITQTNSDSPRIRCVNSDESHNI